MADTNAMVIGVDDFDADFILTQSGASHLVNTLIPIARILKADEANTVPKSVMSDALKELKHGLRMSGITRFIDLQSEDDNE